MPKFLIFSMRHIVGLYEGSQSSYVRQALQYTKRVASDVAFTALAFPVLAYFQIKDTFEERKRAKQAKIGEKLQRKTTLDGLLRFD